MRSAHLTAAFQQSLACKKHKPAPFDRQIEEIFITELQKSTFVLCSQIEALAYPTAEAPEEVREEGTFVGNDELAGKGMERAHRKERVKQAGRRVVVFGKDYECKSPNGKTLDPSFAHGDWGVGRV
ncbi:MAG: hypothetical protein M1827_006381 [Pycnora praestabilis]|nr:MAG: hypothetical protein M1827_006381 [Pycnora praestabilis]